MNRTLRASLAAIFVGVITFSAISIFQNLGKSLRADITDQKLYTLSDGTKKIIAKLHQPITLKLYYARAAAMKGPDQIRFYTNYYYFVRALLDEYVRASNGMVKLEVIDPRPFSDQEAEALRYGIKKFPLSEDENFFFGLVAQTQFGVSKSIAFFSPDRQNFVEYDLSYLIDTAIARQKKRIGVLSSLPVMGDDVSGYMAQMMQMQGQEPKPAWTIIEQIKQQYEVTKVETETAEIKDVDVLLVVHPKELSEKTQFAIDQYVLKGGRAIVCVDPYCVLDKPNRQQMQYMSAPQMGNSSLPRLLGAWGLEMPDNTFAADRDLALLAGSNNPNGAPQKIIAFLELTKKCFGTTSSICSNLNQVRMLFAGSLKANTGDPNYKLQYTNLVQTTDRGNTVSISSPYELMYDPGSLAKNFSDGSKPVTMGCLVTGRFKSAFPNGIEVPTDANKPEDKPADPNQPMPKTKTIKGLVQATADCAVVVFSDVDFISDVLAFQKTFFGSAVVGDNSAMLMNTIDELCGSNELIAIRSRGNFQRPFDVVNKIESEAEKATADEEAKINAEIQGFQQELGKLVQNAKQGDEELIGNSIVTKKKDLELKIHQAQGKLREVKAKKRERIEELGNNLRTANMTFAPAAILIAAIILGIRRGLRRRHYISHESDS